MYSHLLCGQELAQVLLPLCGISPPEEVIGNFMNKKRYTAFAPDTEAVILPSLLGFNACLSTGTRANIEAQRRSRSVCIGLRLQLG